MCCGGQASACRLEGAYEAELLAGAAAVTVGKHEGEDGSQVVSWRGGASQAYLT